MVSAQSIYSNRRMIARSAKIFVVLAVSACAKSYDGSDDSSAFPPRADAGDDAADAEVAADAGADAASSRCDPSKPFGAPVQIAELATIDQDTVADLSPDELTIYIGSNHGVTGMHLFYATRASPTAPFGARP